MKKELIKNLTDIKELIDDWNAGLIDKERDFLILLREKGNEMICLIEEEEIEEVDYNK